MHAAIVSLLKNIFYWDPIYIWIKRIVNNPFLFYSPFPLLNTNVMNKRTKGIFKKPVYIHSTQILLMPQKCEMIMEQINFLYQYFYSNIGIYLLHLLLLSLLSFCLYIIVSSFLLFFGALSLVIAFKSDNYMRSSMIKKSWTNDKTDTKN